MFLFFSSAIRFWIKADNMYNIFVYNKFEEFFNNSSTSLQLDNFDFFLKQIQTKDTYLTLSNNVDDLITGCKFSDISNLTE